MSTLRKLVGLGFSCLFDFGMGLFCAYLLGRILNRPVSFLEYGIAMVWAVLPDFDAAIQQVSKGDITGAHKDVTVFHQPIMMVGATGMICGLILSFFHSWFWALLPIICLVGHFVHDTLEEGPGIAWFAPFRDQKYRLRWVNGKIRFAMTPEESRHQDNMTLERWLEREYLRVTLNSALGVLVFLAATIVVLMSKPTLF